MRWMPLLLLAGCSRDYAFLENGGGADAGSDRLVADAAPADSERPDAATDAGDACNTATHSCVPAPPAGWSGPVALREAPSVDSPVECDNPWPAPNLLAHEGLEAGSASCSCACSAPEGVVCDPVAVHHGAAGCGPSFNPPGLEAGQCVPLGTWVDEFIQIGSPQIQGGTCMAEPAFDIPSPSWATTLTGCSAPLEQRDCEVSELCAPALTSTFPSLCVYQSGIEAECPAGFDDRRVVFESFTDDRACGSCTCGPATGSCNGRAVFTQSFGTDACGLEGIVRAFVDAGQCGGQVSGIVTHGKYTPEPDGSCEPSTVTLTGAVAEAGPVTLCCRR